MFQFCNSFWVVLCALIFDLFEFIIRHITRLRDIDNFYRRNLDSGDVCNQSENEKSAMVSESDRFTEKEHSDFNFAFKFQIGDNMNKKFAETESSVSSVSKYQFMSGKDVSGFIQEPKAMSFTVQESFGGFTDKDLNFCSDKEQDYGDVKNVSGFIEEPETMSFTLEEGLEGFIDKDLSFDSEIGKDFEGPKNGGSDRFIDFKISDLKDGQNLVSEAEFVYEDQTVDCPKISCSKEDLKGQEELSSEEHEISQPIDGIKGFNLEKEGSLNEIISTTDSSFSDEELGFNKYKSEDTDGEYIELEPRLHQLVAESISESPVEDLHEPDCDQNHFNHLVDESIKESPAEDLHEHRGDHNEEVELLDGVENSEEQLAEKKIWDWESNEEDEVDVLMEHRDLIEQMKMEMKNSSRTGGLPTILEESETPKIAEDLKPLQIDEKFEHRDRMEEINKFYKSYLDKMKKMDILNYQTLHAISFLQMKEPVKVISSQKSAVSAIKSRFLPNFNLGKLRKIYADQTLKSISELHRDLERVYIGQVCLSWEILHWLYQKSKELKEYNPQDSHSYNQVAGEFQQFQVLTQRFIEDEPFQGPRIQNYVKKRHLILSLIQVPTIKDDCFKDKTRGEDEEGAISIAMLAEIIVESMRVFWEFLRADKDESLKGIHGTKLSKQHAADMELFMDIKSSLQKKEKRLKEILRSGNCIVKKFQKHQGGRVKHEILISQVEMRLVSRVLNMPRLTREQLQWCQTKLNNINFVNRRISVEPSFLLYPC